MTTTAMSTTEAMVASLYSGHVFAAGIMSSVAYMALAVTRFVSLEVVEWPRTMIGQRSGVAMVWIETVVDVAVEAMGAVKPGPGSDKQSASEPVRPIVAVWCAVIRCVIEVPVWAHRCDSNVNRYLSRRDRSSTQ
jgi:hypothetical protein